MITGARQPKVKDRVKVTIQGPIELGGTLNIGPQDSMTFWGVIVEEKRDTVVVQLDTTINGVNHIEIDKPSPVAPR